MALIPPLKDIIFDGLQSLTGAQPRSRAIWLRSLPGIYTLPPHSGTVLFNGLTFDVNLAGPVPADGSEVSLVIIDGSPWAMAISGAYPSYFPRPLSDFAKTNPAGTFLAYVMRDNPKYKRYQVAEIVDGNTTTPQLYTARTSDGKTINVYAEFGGVVSQWGYFRRPSNGELLFQKDNGEWIAIAEDYYYWISTGDPAPGYFAGTETPDVYRAFLTLQHNFTPERYRPSATFSYTITGPGAGRVSAPASSPVAYSAVAWVDGGSLSIGPFTLTQSGLGSAGEYVDFRLTATTNGVLNPAYTNTARYYLAY